MGPGKLLTKMDSKAGKRDDGDSVKTVGDRRTGVDCVVMASSSSSTSPTVREEPISHSTYSIYRAREQVVAAAGTLRNR